MVSPPAAPTGRAPQTRAQHGKFTFVPHTCQVHAPTRLTPSRSLPLPLPLIAAAAAAAAPAPLFTTAPPELEGPGAPAHAPRQLCAPSASPAAGAAPSWTCSNWAGTVTWRPAEVFAPESEADLAAYLAAADAASRSSGAPRPALKVVGFAHSWAGLYVPAGAGTDANTTASGAGVTLALHRLSGITRLGNNEVEVLAGTSFASLFAELDARGLALAWSPGGIQGLTVGGAVAVGFHGSQLSLGGVSSVVRGLRLLDTAGNAVDLTDESDPEAMRAARMGLGMCGVVTRVTLPVVPQFHLRRRRWRVGDAAGFLRNQLPGLKTAHDRFHYYVHPATGSAWPMYWEAASAAESQAEARPCRTALEQHEDAEVKEFGVDGLPLIMRWDNCSDASHRSLTHAVDMEKQPLWNGEYYVALDDGAEADAVLEILDRFRAAAAARAGDESAGVNPDVWMHVRYVGGDTASLLNPCYGARACAAFELALVAPAMDAPLPPWAEWDAYFSAMQDVLVALGGRPHHAKYHSLARPPPTPGFGLPVAEFRAQCARFDPARLMRNEAFDRLFGFGGAPAAAAGTPDAPPAVEEL